MVGPSSQHSSEEDGHEDTSLLSISHLISKLATLQLDTEYISVPPVATEHQLVSLQSCHPDYAVQCQAADIPLLHQAQEASCCFLQKECQQGNFSETSCKKKNAVKLWFREFTADANSYSVCQLACEAEYMMNSSFLWKRDVETVSGQTDCPYLICDTDYKASGCFTAKIADDG